MAILKDLYRPLYLNETPIVLTDVPTAELTKYAANALLATKISFINEMANLCERMGGDINDVRRGIGHDSRIGFSSSFPVQAAVAASRRDSLHGPRREVRARTAKCLMRLAHRL
jgi:UDP-glucose 6-dehydrogenase